MWIACLLAALVLGVSGLLRSLGTVGQRGTFTVTAPCTEDGPSDSPSWLCKGSYRSDDGTLTDPHAVTDGNPHPEVGKGFPVTRTGDDRYTAVDKYATVGAASLSLFAFVLLLVSLPLRATRTAVAGALATARRKREAAARRRQAAKAEERAKAKAKAL
ncbi:hypothetical protein KUM39_02400 [Streptomyces sp. J2-1]|uniref:hypothetical protein n=1 Tax=Streptomyces corallincola TaxID=2851888 RepID=UPI001C387A8A|nr:hypothetical protein [Streptomyces corallincola]MBV2353221.1 hypothetical protein [Streptomyces corallincola]